MRTAEGGPFCFEKQLYGGLFDAYGYAVYEVDGAHTVMAVDRCGDCRYDFTDGTYQVIPAEEFENMEWSIRLLMEGERRMEHNRNKTSDKFENTVLECDGSDWSVAVMVDFMDDCKAEVLADKELKRLYAAMSKLTERQSEIIQLYYYKGLSQYEIADELGIRQQSVDRILKQAVNRLRKNEEIFKKCLLNGSKRCAL